MRASAMPDESGAGPTGRSLVWLVFAVFFIWGGATSLNDVLIPKLKGLFALTYAEAMLTQFAFFGAYFLFSIPAGQMVSRVGYVRGLVIGLAVMAAGALLFWPAGLSGAYWPFLIALFVLAAGITVLQVAANPLIATLGRADGASSRLTFAQAFNSLGTTIWPYIGAQLILGSVAAAPAPTEAAQAAAFRSAETAIVGHIYLGIAAVLAFVAAVFWTRRNVLPTRRPTGIGFADSLSLLGQPRLRFGTIALFLYVGAEVSIGSLLVSYLEQPDTLALSAHRAGELLSLYWGGAMLGRFLGAWLLRRINPGKLLSVFAAAAAALVLLSMATSGAAAGGSLIAVGLFNSIMFPTIFSLSLQGQGDKAAEASGLLCMAIVGGAVVPILTGGLADALSISGALILPALCYLAIAGFGRSARQPVEG